nr:ribonuclease H-like domain, reverse transcriptase, RNA-dependent DNA polymerase [Tanacetum cinerariifolium]
MLEIKKRPIDNNLNKNLSPINVVSSSCTTVDPGRERTQRNEFEGVFGQDKDANGNRIFTFVSAAGSTYVYLGGSIPVNAATLPNDDLPTDPLMPDLEDTADTRIFSDAYDDEVEGVEADFNNLELTIVPRKYVADILKKVDFSLVKTVSTPVETNNALLKDEEAMDVDVHLYRSLIGSLMYLTASRDSPFDLKAFSDSDYAGASLDRKSITGEYVAVANCYGQRKETEVPHTEPQTKESVPTTSNDLLPSGEDRLQLTELMNLCTSLQKHVLDLVKAKTAQAKKIVDLKKRVKKLERKENSRTSGLKRLWKVGSTTRVESSDEKGLGDQDDASKQGMITEIDADEDLSLIDETAQDQERLNEEEMFSVDDLDGEEVKMDVTTGENVEQDATVAEKEVSTADPVTNAGEVVTTAEGVEVTTAAAAT